VPFYVNLYAISSNAHIEKVNYLAQIICHLGDGRIGMDQLTGRFGKVVICGADQSRAFFQ
jgi:hypothetical protein